jgi:protein Mpv17
MAYGFLMTPLQFWWYGRLSKWFPVTSARGTIPALQRVAMDQLLFAPCSLAWFFTFMTVAEGGEKRHLVKKMQDIYLPTLRANYILWPAVQVINFRFMPLSFQIPFVSTIGIAWTAYLSLNNASEDESMDV